MIGDTKASPTFEFTDAELDFFYTTQASSELNGAAAYACMAWAARLTSGWQRVQTDGLSRDRGSAVKDKLDLAKMYEGLSSTVSFSPKAIFGRARADWSRRSMMFPLRDRELAEAEEGS
jgi:hypothetical protein